MRPAMLGLEKSQLPSCSVCLFAQYNDGRIKAVPINAKVPVPLLPIRLVRLAEIE
jgi:hypothetical protein